MKERPILFSGEMVRATLRDVDPKTQTRRIMNPQPKWCAQWGTAVGKNGAWLIGSPAALGYAHSGDHWQAEFNEDTRRRYCTQEAYGWGAHVGCPYGVVGDRLWVRETWNTSARCLPAIDEPYIYAADLNEEGRMKWAATWKPSIHMPRAASRITLEVTGVSVERLKDISSDDCFAEGIDPEGADYSEGEHYAIAGSPISAERWAFAALWDSLAAPGADWNANPWVWVVQFRRIV